MLYPEIKPHIKSELEELTDRDISTGYRIIDFWKWSMSDLLSNVTRGIFAEFIVLTAIGLDKAHVRDEWADYDLLSLDGKIRIEVKSASYIQAWGQKQLSNISFSIKPSERIGDRPSDKYVFCLLKHIDQNTIDPMKLEQWEFYVVNTTEINKLGNQKTISLGSLIKITDAIPYHQLRDEILV